MYEVTFHIGFMKTATTWLQKTYFPSIQGVTYLGRDHVNNFFLKDDELSYNPDVLKGYYQKEYPSGTRLILSSERILGSLNMGYRNGSFLKCNVDRIANVFPDARIILFIRNQENLISSSYIQYVRNGGNFPVHRYLFANENSLFCFQYLEFHKTIEYLKRKFKSVYVFVYEDFENNPWEFIQKFGKQLNFETHISKEQLHKRQNQSMRNGFLYLYRLLNFFYDGNGASKYQITNIPYLRYLKNRLYHRLDGHIFFNSPSNPERILGKKNIEYIRNYYAESNSILIKNHNLSIIQNFNYSTKI